MQEAEELNLYKWSSFSSYSGSYPHLFINTDFILKMFGGKKNRLIKFISDQVGYQRRLDQIKHLTFE
ncbi:hypothetical protein A2686_01365 [Candidatus Woesebacteria bacterium RIFCSPHIGHO2_01_FULL_38_10]|uniref:Uncharacterized protein n=1 Tax=Candidatus Woesebacteria bacterium RIFCSPLOWO2_01_FULL_39_10b TaxID=1802517 RepID=A0A1F8B9J7_9BACT|nr:MAG: hypothetical protein A2686_01365 [Candidatus Woesebacteria bacterium RIFCSPHIGHO2_01_FULL_38_10]OGM60724.1 MAG: hypothetical protein A2892_01630 [Candidatus Woesebacteria bacterium RIFCSPLOWO2_01_FULL_39_10b]